MDSCNPPTYKGLNTYYIVLLGFTLHVHVVPIDSEKCQVLKEFLSTKFLTSCDLDLGGPLPHMPEEI